MLEKRIEFIANKLGCHYEHSETFIKSFGGSNISISCHYITYSYKSEIIKLTYEFGSETSGKVECIIHTNETLPDFKIKTKSHLKRLFSNNNFPFVIACKDANLKLKLIKLLENSGYVKIAQDSLFEPSILGKLHLNSYNISTQFFLGFKEKEQAILPSINLYKSIIDELS